MQRNGSSASSSALSSQYLRSQGAFSPPVAPAPVLHRTMTAPVQERREREASVVSNHANAAPVAAAGSIFNKPTTISLYQTCRIIADRLRDVPGFEEAYLPTGPDAENAVSPVRHPVSDLWRCFRLGASLCHLYNATGPESELSVRAAPSTTNLNACKAEVYHFLLACRTHLGFGDEDLFTISELYSENTNGFVKVTRTVSKVLDLLQEKDLLITRRESDKSPESAEAPKDNKAKVIEELLETERKYVQYLEILQNYMRELQAGEVISADTLHMLFANLNSLVDFQRRFLIGIETTCALPADQQRIGLVFTNLEEAFDVYEPFCANYTYAAELVVEETPKLKKLAHLVEPTYELPSLLIKPIQRICKYPLLLRELLKFSDSGETYYSELEAGEAAIKRVTDRVNETRRRQENELVVMELERRVEDWKGHSVASFGSLLLEDTFQVVKGEVEREYKVYLFERILLCCKEGGPNKKNSKSMSITKKPKKRASLQLKGRIFINNVTEIVPLSRNGVHTLQVYWRGDQDLEYFTLRCRHEENLRQWQTALGKLLEEAKVAMAEYRSSQTVVGASRNTSTTLVNSIPSMSSHYIEPQGYDSDEESHRTEDTADDNESLASSTAMSREPSSNSMFANSVRSRSTTNESMGGLGYARYNSGSGPNHRIISNGTPRYLHILPDGGNSQFSPALDTESSYGSKAGNSGASYPFPRTSHPEGEWSTGHTRNTAPPMSRTSSREGSSGRPMYSVQGGRNSNSSLIQRPGMSQRTRSASSPNPNAYPARPSVSIPEMPPPLPASSGTFNSSPAGSSRGSIKGSPSGSINAKVNFGDDIFIVLLSPDATFQELTDRVVKKIRLCSNSPPDTAYRIKYKDEDGDMVTINSDEDVSMALESGIDQFGGMLNLFASPLKR